MRGNIQSILAVIIIILGFYILAFNNSQNDVKIAVVGLMSAVVGYFFGSSSGSAKKDETINNLNNKENA